VRAMVDSGFDVVVLDDLSTGDRRRLPTDVPLVTASVLEGPVLTRVLRDHDVHGVVHLAGKKAVDESVTNPLHYYRQNVVGGLTLLESMTAAGVDRLVFSSSAAVYGTPDESCADDQVGETAETRPESPYGRTKLVSEWMIQDAATASGMSCVSLRYFNVVGAARPELADTGGANLFPRVMRALASGDTPMVFGTDYPTRDGSCVRDYIHVQDLAEAHVAAARLVSSAECVESVNIGCGRGHTVLEVLATIGAVTGRDTTARVCPRRAGDPIGLVAEVTKSHLLLGWSASRGLRAMVSSSWEGIDRAPSGVEDDPVTPSRD
jgi:UDP-glucose 4-epimerase